jgi:hypothetical protein
LALRDLIREVHMELAAALDQMGRDLAQGSYSGVVLRQDEWTKYAPTIKNDPVFADVARGPRGCSPISSTLPSLTRYGPRPPEEGVGPREARERQLPDPDTSG